MPRYKVIIRYMNDTINNAPSDRQATLDVWVKPYAEAWLRGDLMAINRLSSAWLMSPAVAYSHILAMALQMGRITKAQHDRCVSRSRDLLLYINQ